MSRRSQLEHEVSVAQERVKKAAKDTWMFWFMMQLAMLVGFFCAYPMNALLIKLGVKKGM